MLIAPTAAALAPYVQSFWASPASPARPGQREQVLPGGQMHLALRLDGAGVRLYADAGAAPARHIGHAVVAGAHDRPYFKDVSESSRSVGVLLLPGAAQALFGCNADELSNRHVPLADLCGGAAETLLQRLAGETAPARQIALLQAFLLRRLRPVRAMQPPVAQAIAALRDGGAVAPLVQASGCSHKRFIALFRAQTGLAPKCFARVQRLQQVLHAPPSIAWAELALQAGYSDQAHFNREFRALTGLTPQAWRRCTPRNGAHVPLPPPGNFVQYRGEAAL
ncbi:helix-turn-helix domain-containing protein [Tahibacter harae]|uniref:Helix-turn-helix domain-containing protein n=1 Tax=Tahibacter harae TaxID=2963937 RepID=A0ABT1QRF5_9GAMM|nr:helix-turn-helix domain-containing protein [Tahibacter harae]MCQ4164858.1 helix-turn-helix domain-containing protein [Tahibacter harae]